MTVIAVANPKGGVGKTTLATNLAGYYAAQGEWVALADLDRQRSAHGWLALRAASLPMIEAWDLHADQTAKPPQGLERVIVDTPAGLHGRKLEMLLSLAERIIVPLQPSMFDILATRDFLLSLAEEKALRKARNKRHVQIGIVGMRVDPRTRSAEELKRYVESLGLPVLGYLRDTQNYVQLAAHGLTLWDVAAARVEKDVQQWAPVLDWVDGSP